MKNIFLCCALLTSTIQAYSFTDIQYLYGNFEGPTFLDTKNGAKNTVTVEHYRTWDYGDLFMFADYSYAKDGLQFTNKKNDLYGEFSPRLSINKIANISNSSSLVKEWFLAYQHNRGDGFRADLFGLGTDLNIPGFQVFSLNLYRKAIVMYDDTYQLSANYYASLGENWHFEGFSDWTTKDFLTQNQLLFNLSPLLDISNGKLEIGTEWHYYHENTYHTDNDVFQAMIKYTW